MSTVNLLLVAIGALAIEFMRQVLALIFDCDDDDLPPGAAPT